MVLGGVSKYATNSRTNNSFPFGKALLSPTSLSAKVSPICTHDPVYKVPADASFDGLLMREVFTRPGET